MKFLSKFQKTWFCQWRPGSLDILIEAGRLTRHECKRQFASRRWNCPTFPDEKNGGSYNKIKINNFPGNKETAFLQTLTSSSMAYVITKGCASGAIFNCGCDTDRRDFYTTNNYLNNNYNYNNNYNHNHNNEDDVIFKWGGCSDDVIHGIEFTKNLIDESSDKIIRIGESRINPDKINAKKAMLQHNVNTGRDVLLNSIIVKCKCHGISGSCQTKTCWRTLSQFQSIAAEIMTRYDHAEKIERGVRKNIARVVARDQKNNNNNTNNLVYVINSPTYCTPLPKFDFYGTTGRTCDRKSGSQYGSCDVTCCGRGYVTVVRRVTERCNCQFHYCCTVTCEKCERSYDEHLCK
ncbi:hypothetical protein HELRODRAFT_90849 [Helobdella robusta]|uniref:Protein Wnt n=1 Tax=Helobdella robusta TaxID=6412 RepID=T1G7X0_HELRO|nr:hypothetical protein HELRODRAFT_90849 [Helobdella robusta]ESN90242.1 hypothetical protein HELRODRAFT_90849 [Helobdella robusta]